MHIASSSLPGAIRARLRTVLLSLLILGMVGAAPARAHTPPPVPHDLTVDVASDNFLTVCLIGGIGAAIYFGISRFLLPQRGGRMIALLATIASILTLSRVSFGPAALAAASPAASVHIDTPMHGGQIQAVGNNHLEAVVRPDRSVTLYVMGILETLPYPVAADTLWGSVGTATTRVMLHAAPQKGDPAGQASVFTGQLPEEVANGKAALTVTVPLSGQDQQVTFDLDPSASATASSAAPVHDTSAVKVVATAVTPEQKALFLTPGGAYTAADIAANGGVTPDQKFQGLMANHHLNPKKGDVICPITRTTANPRFPWIVGGKRYLFCCPPCVAEFVRQAKTQPKSLLSPQTYVQK